MSFGPRDVDAAMRVDCGLMSEVFAVADIEGCTAMMIYFGGTNFYIPHRIRLKDNHALCRVLGREAAEKITDTLGGLTCWVPSAHKLTSKLIGQWMVDLERTGQIPAGTIAKILRDCPQEIPKEIMQSSIADTAPTGDQDAD